MHYVALVILPKRVQNVEAAVKKAMAPFDEDIRHPPRKVAVVPRTLEVAANYYEINPSDLAALARKWKDWSGRRGVVEDGVLKELQTDNPNGLWDWYQIGGRWNDWLPGKRQLCWFIPRDKVPYCFITPGNVFVVRETYVMGDWDEGRFVETPDFEEKYHAALGKFSDHLAVVVDYHS